MLRNAVHDALTARHHRLDRPGQWYDDPAGELNQHARADIATFGFWQALLARRSAGPDAASGQAASNVYPTADASSILIGANQDTAFRRLAEVMGRPELAADDRYATHHARGERQQELDGLIARWSATYDATELLELLHEGGVPAGRVYRAEDMFADEHFTARNAIVRVRNSRGHEFAMQNVAPRLSDTPGGVRWSGPELGEHTDDVLAGLGYAAAAIERLRNDAIV
ncbi:CoA transferase [Pseudonocardia acidicola]|uniref:CoA transferase n=1 Tax=Pseudonocardia acidicola TaxID=2724939 RepID=UPI001B7CDC5A